MIWLSQISLRKHIATKLLQVVICMTKEAKHQNPLWRWWKKDHIESSNPTVAHYKRKHAPLMRYLSSVLAIVKLHTDYKEKTGSQILYSHFQKVFKSMNISMAMDMRNVKLVQNINFKNKVAIVNLYVNLTYMSNFIL